MYPDDNQKNQNNSINPATGNFSDNADIIEKNSISRIQQHNYENHADMTYCAESTPNQADSSSSSYSTAYYTVNPQTQQSESIQQKDFSIEYASPIADTNATANHTNRSSFNNQENVKKITNNRMSGAVKGIMIACICLSLVLGITAGSLISSYVFRSSYNKPDGSNSQGSQSIGSNSISPDNSSSGNITSGFLTYAIEDKDTSPLSTAEIAAKCGVSVVEIRTETVTTGKWMQEYVTEGAGSGVILTQDGYIVTNNHVIAGANKIKVTLQDGKDYEAKLIGRDEKSDIALIKIEADGLTPASVGDSNKLVVGEKAVAIGNPLGELGGTVTDGIISALDREVTIDGNKMSLLQTNAAINPGNSGGGLFNGAGNLVAIVDAKSSGEGIEGLGFAIPVNDMAAVVQQLMDYGYVKGYTDTGMTFIDITDTLTAMQYRVNSLGVYVLKVSGDKALEAGFQSGDLVTKVDGQEVSSSGDIDSVISTHQVGDQIEFEVYRSRGYLTLKLTLTEFVPESDNT